MSSTIGVVSEAYHIAANYLKETGLLNAEVNIHQPLLESIANDFRSGKQSKLMLAERLRVLKNQRHLEST